MEAHASPIKATPGRRRHPRSKPAPLKAYASENDAANYVASTHHHHKTPQTPKKILSASPALAESQSAQTGSKQRNRSHKPKGKFDAASPNYHLSSSQSPPRSSPPSKPGTNTPFAGATFHASPAPADLPIPSFLKSHSESSPMVRKTRGVDSQPSPPATDSEAPTPYRPVSASQHRESPLDFMFRAHREEKARQQFDNTAGPASLLAGIMSPPHHTDTPLSPTSSNLAQNRGANSRQSSGGNEIFELDGTGSQSLGPAFSTPYKDRISAARSIASTPPTSHTTPQPTSSTNTTAEDPTEALKRFLFAPKPSTATAPSMSLPNPTLLPPRNIEPFANSQVDGSGYDSAGSIQAMENDLRRILKLDMVTERPPADRRLFSR